MSLKKYLLAGGLSTVLILGACNGDDTATEEETDDAATEETDDAATDDTTEDDAEDDTADDTTEDDAEDDTADDADDSAEGEEDADGDITYSGEYGDFTVVSFSQDSLEPEEVEGEEVEGEEGEEAEPVDVVMFEFEYTNNSDVPTAPEEAFGLELAVRQMDEGGEVTLDNHTMDIPEDHEQSDLIEASGELIEPGDSATAVVAYGPVDTSLETALQSRNDDDLDETIELDGAEGEDEDTDATDEETDESADDAEDDTEDDEDSE